MIEELGVVWRMVDHHQDRHAPLIHI